MNLGWTEILLIGGIALLLFGPKKLPSLGRSMGEAIRGFKKGLNEDATVEKPVEQISQNDEVSVKPQTTTKKEPQEPS